MPEDEGISAASCFTTRVLEKLISCLTKLQEKVNRLNIWPVVLGEAEAHEKVAILLQVMRRGSVGMV